MPNLWYAPRDLAHRHRHRGGRGGVKRRRENLHSNMYTETNIDVLVYGQVHATGPGARADADVDARVSGRPCRRRRLLTMSPPPNLGIFPARHLRPSNRGRKKDTPGSTARYYGFGPWPCLAIGLWLLPSRLPARNRGEEKQARSLTFREGERGHKCAVRQARVCQAQFAQAVARLACRSLSRPSRYYKSLSRAQLLCRLWQVRRHMHARSVSVNQLMLLSNLAVKGCERTWLIIKTIEANRSSICSKTRSATWHVCNLVET